MKDLTKDKSITFCNGGRLHSSTTSNECHKTKIGHKLLFRKFVQCSRTKSRIVTDNPKAAKPLHRLFKELEKRSAML